MIILGAFYGLLLSNWLTPGVISGKPMDDSLFKMAARFILGLFLVMPWLLFRILVQSYATQTSNAYTLLLFKGVIPGLLTGVSLFWFADVLNEKLGILKMQKKPAATTTEKNEEDEKYEEYSPQ